ncbi:MAG: hypothetical protein K6E38_00690 [Fretibacterium sp.]|nr:hypothetical protein [Fretibacterium sp.]
MTVDSGLVAYLLRVFIALAILSLCAFTFVHFSRRKTQRASGGVAVKLLTSLPLGKDVFFVVRCGPDVLAFTLGGAGACLMGRWKYAEWLDARNTEGSISQEG